MNPIAFFSPAYLWGLLALAIPLAIHLINRRRTLTLRFSTNRFFTPSAVKADRMRTLRRLLQLLARLLAVCALVLLFARPYDAHDPFGIVRDQSVPLYIWVDRSISMTYRDNGLELLAQAGQLLDTLATVRPRDGSLMLWSPDRGAFASAATRGARSLSAVHGPSDCNSMLSAFAALHTQGDGRAVLLTISDFQLPVKAALDSFLADTINPVKLVAAMAGPLKRSNVRVSVEHGDGTMARVTAKGAAFTGTLVVKAEGLTVARKPVQLAAGESLMVALDLPPQTAGRGGVLELEGADPYQADNRVPFTVRHRAHGDILVVGEPAAIYPVVAALSVSGSGRTIKQRTAAQLTHDDVAAAPLLILDQLQSLPTVLTAQIAARSLGRKALIVAPACNAASGWLLPLEPSVQLRCRSTEPQTGVYLSDTLSWLWKGFARSVAREVSFDSWISGLRGTVMARMGTGEPFATTVRDSAGVLWIMLASHLGAGADNNLCETGFFVPFIDRLSRYGLAAVAADQSPWIAGYPHANPLLAQRVSGRVFDESQGVISQWGSQPFVALESPGLYRLVAQSLPEQWIAVISDPAESDSVGNLPQAQAGKHSAIAQVALKDLGVFIRRLHTPGIAAALWWMLGLALLAELLCRRARPPLQKK